MKVHTIFGPPGTGKTARLVDIAEEHAIHSDNILFLSYSKAAAAEAADRLDSNRVKVSTIHALAYAAMNLDRAAVIDRRKLEDFGNHTGIQFKGMDDTDEQQEGDEYLSVVSYARNSGMPPHESYYHFGAPGTFARFAMFCNAYADFKQTYGFVDFDDMMEAVPCLSVRRWPVVILDEAQDLSPLQWRSFNKIITDADHVYVAGDDDQAIYEWNGADPHGMIEFAEANDSGHEVLAQSYRVPIDPMILASTSTLSLMNKRVKKEFFARAAKGNVIRYGDIDDFDFNTLICKDAMILVRDAWRRREVQRVLNDAYIPYRQTDGNSPYENKYARGIRGWLRFQERMHTDADFRAIQEIGSTATRLMEQKEASNHRWQTVLNVPPRLWDFYEKAPLFDPLTIILSTVHQAKGKEASTVLVDLTMPARVVDGISRDRDAELRVLYVSLTRCRNELILCGRNPLL